MIKEILQDCLSVILVGCLLVGGSAFAEVSSPENQAVAIFAGGCFWCMEPAFDVLPGVISTITGYTGGHTENPTYKEVSNGKSGHFEAVKVTYDPSKISYDKLLDAFWHNIDPFNSNGQFCDNGDQYKAVVFYSDEKQRQLAEASLLEIKKKLLGKSIVTSILPAGKFYPAEDYHQDYYLKYPIKYKFYRFSCGRDHRLSEIWDG